MKLFGGTRKAPPGGAETAAPRYSLDYPSAQNQLDIFRGEWTSAVPAPDEETTSGPRTDLFRDERIAWLLDGLGSLQGFRVLELGPLEGGHTWMLEQAGGHVVAIEANERAFLRCLVVKNLLGMRSRFLYGDFVQYLRRSDQHFDLIVASGVLYHMIDPLQLLDLLAAHARRIFLWTHYYDDAVMARRPDVAARFAGVQQVAHADATYELHRYEYREGRQDAQFCGGAMPEARWMRREDIVGFLAAHGFTRQDIAFDDPDGPHGPAFALTARAVED